MTSIAADLDAVRARRRRGALASGRTPKPMMMASEAAARTTSVSVMAPTAEWMVLMRTSDWSILSSGVWQRLDGALDVGLDDEVELS